MFDSIKATSPDDEMEPLRSTILGKMDMVDFTKNAEIAMYIVGGLALCMCVIRPIIRCYLDTCACVERCCGPKRSYREVSG